MKSTAYRVFACNRCRRWTGPHGGPKGPLYASKYIGWWVMTRVERSEYIRELTSGCSGCADVYEDKVRVLGNLLYKLGVIKMLCFDKMLSFKK
jgi:hypothetical protein